MACMERKAMAELLKWKARPDRMPLILEGARQTGKTWLLKEFGRTRFKKTVYINFDADEEAKALFSQSIQPSYIIQNLEYREGVKLNPGETLIIFDEIQECNRALNSLKYFCEEAPSWFVTAAGSLLGVAIHGNSSFPVGKVQSIRLRPLSFREFLAALSETRLDKIMQDGAYGSLAVIHHEMTARLKQYYFIGGMPRAVAAFVEDGNLERVREIQLETLGNFEKDFSKHINASSIPKVGIIWNSIPVHLAKEKKEFIYKELKQGARASQFEDAMHWLEMTGLVYRLSRIDTSSLPLAAFKGSTFKLYMLDVGLLSAKTGLTMRNLAEGDDSVFNYFKGALTEQFVMEELLNLSPVPEIVYWANDRSKGTAEVDFVIQYNGEIIPVEAKSSINLKAKSLQVYRSYYKPRFAVRSSLAAYSQNSNLFDIPLYALGYLPKLLGL
jgi:predicted AAA+ superfamily ATPase